MGVTVGCKRAATIISSIPSRPPEAYYAMAGIFRSTEMLSGLQRRPRDNASYFNVSLLAKLNYAPEGEAKSSPIPARPRSAPRSGEQTGAGDHRYPAESPEGEQPNSLRRRQEPR